MKSFRPDKVASVIREIVSTMIVEKLQDPRISRFTSVTRVEVSGDLQHAKVYFSVMGRPADERGTLRGLNHARGRIQRAVAAGITARTCPQLVFEVDESLKRAQEIIRVIDENVPPAPDEYDEPADEAVDSEPAGHAEHGDSIAPHPSEEARG
jgi:ribosome-binding factor A